MTKNETISQSLKNTKETRKWQVCKVYELKIDKSSLSKEKEEFLNRLFLEAKWLYNSILSSEDIFKYSTKGLEEIEVLNKDKEKEKRELKCLSGQMKQSILDRLKQNILNLSKSKKSRKVRRVGKLKFKSVVDSIPLKQHFQTFAILRGTDFIKIQGIKKKFRVHGMEQIKDKFEISNAVLKRRNGDYYLKVTTFQDKKIDKITHQDIGIDFGIKDSLTFSNGVKIKVKIENCKRLKKLQRKLRNKKKKGTSNRNKLNVKIAKKYQRLTNKKNDVSNKIVNYLRVNFDNICVQDDSFNNWKKNRSFSRTVQSSILGRTLSKLKTIDKTRILGRFVPSTSECYICKTRNEIKLSDRVFTCKSCGHIEDRDLKSAKYILFENLSVPMECREVKLVESVTSLRMKEYFEKSISGIFISYIL